MTERHGHQRAGDCGWRHVTRVTGSRPKPDRTETCDPEEPYEGKLHVRFCGGVGRVIADPTRMARCCASPSLAIQLPSCLLQYFVLLSRLPWLGAATNMITVSGSDHIGTHLPFNLPEENPYTLPTASDTSSSATVRWRVIPAVFCWFLGAGAFLGYLANSACGRRGG